MQVCYPRPNQDSRSSLPRIYLDWDERFSRWLGFYVATTCLEVAWCTMSQFSPVRRNLIRTGEYALKCNCLKAWNHTCAKTMLFD